MFVLLTAHIAAAIAGPLLVRRLGRNAFLVLAAVPALSAVWLSWVAVGLVGVGSDDWRRAETLTWVPSLGMDLSLRLDPLSCVMAVIATAVGALVLVYCSRYFASNEPGLGRFAGVLMAFSGAMLGLVLADNVLVLYVMWELTTVFSFLLIGHDSVRKFKRRAALQALMVTTFGGLALLVGLIMLATTAGSYLLSDIVAQGIGSNAASLVALILVVCGAVSKSALVPFHFWLPAAMAAPTPVSAYLHAAAMVKAGVFLVAAITPAVAGVWAWQATLLILGLATLLFGGWAALRQHDLKLLLAYGTVSQLGFMMVLLGAGTQIAATAGLALVIAHSMFKAALFLVVGIIDHTYGTRDIRRLNGLAASNPALAIFAVLAALSMAGFPPALGFVAKETALEAFAHGDWLATATLVAVVVGSVLTAAYSIRFCWGAFGPTSQVEAAEKVRLPAALIVPVGVLASGGLAAGLLAPFIDGIVHAYAQQLPGERYSLALWHGLSLSLGLSVMILLLGLGLARTGTRFNALQQRLSPNVSANSLYVKMMRKLDRSAAVLTAITQRGSLAFYVGTILSVLTIFGLVGLLQAPWPQQWRWWDSPWQAVPIAVAIGAAIAAVRATRRMGAVLLVGVVGYSVGVIFALHGAPDLALTQMLVETMTLVVFVLVMRKLPARITSSATRLRTATKLMIAIPFGIVMAGVAAVASGARQAPSVALAFPEEAFNFGGGKNVVNVTLVDIRAWDTLGEISVLVVAATGVASLIFLRRRGQLRSLPNDDQRQDHHDQHGVDWLRWSRFMAPEQRSVVLEVITRMLFHTVLILSVYLLFAGHNAPGGGFAGGLVAGLALVIRYLAGGRHELGEAAPVDAGLMLALGLLLAGGTGAVGMILGFDVLQTAIVEASVPVLGDVKLVTSLFFDIGVYAIVVGLVLDILRSLGAELDRREGAH